MGSKWNSFRTEIETGLREAGVNPGAVKIINIPPALAGKVIGKGGATIKTIRAESGANVFVKGGQIEISGDLGEIKKAERLIGKETGAQPTSKLIHIGHSQIGILIGSRGANVKAIQSASGARIKIIPVHGGGENANADARVEITGTTDQIKDAQILIAEKISTVVPETVIALNGDGGKLYLRQIDRTMKEQDIVNLYPDANPYTIPKITIRTDKSGTGVYATLTFGEKNDTRKWMHQLNGRMLGDRLIVRKM